MRSIALRISTCALLAGPTVVAFFSGGFFDEARLWTAAAVWLIVLAVALVASRPLPRARASRAALAGLVLLTGWTLLSMAWAPLAGAAWHDAQRLSLYSGALVAATALLADPRSARAVEPALVAGAVAICVFGLSERLVPGLVDLTNSESAQGRLDQPLTYWNAVGSVLAIGLVLAIRLTGAGQRASWMRLAAAGAAPWLGLGVYLTLSRGALAALAIGVLVLLMCAPTAAQLKAAALALAAGGVAALAATSLDGVQAARPTTGEGLVLLAVLVVLSAVCVAGAAVLARSGEGRELRWARARRSPVATGGLVIALAAIAAVALISGSDEPPPVAGEVDPAGAQRLQTLGSNRYDYWEVALGMAARDPISGAGSGSFRVDWLRERQIEERVQDAHSLLLETAAELGLVGLILLGTVAGGVAVASRRALRMDPLLGPGLAAALSAWALHAQLDWLWEMPAATLNVLLLAGAALALGEDRPRPRRDEPIS